MDNENISRRDFVSLTIGAGIAAAAGAQPAAQMGAVETDVEIRTPDGLCDAAFVRPTSGRHPAVIVWTDAFGLRPSMRDIARRLARDGYAVLVPNPFYRVAKSPVFENASTFNFGDQAQRARLTPLMGSINAADAAERDAGAFVAWLDTQAAVDRNRKVGAQGYCMGGALVFRTAAALVERMGAGASFHGGGLVTPNATSPHLLAPRIKARMYVGIAANDDAQQPDAKTKLKEAFDAASVTSRIEVYPQAQHGWCVPDMPAGATGPIYSRADAEQAWTRLQELYRAALV